MHTLQQFLIEVSSLVFLGGLCLAAVNFYRAVTWKPKQEEPLAVDQLDAVIDELIRPTYCRNCRRELEEHDLWDEDQCQVCGGLTPCACHQESPL